MPPAPDLTTALRETFGHEAFRPGQEEVVRAVLEGRDVLAIMPTGGGKSLCYQLPALLSDGLTLVVSPLIALMKDQVDALVANGHPATFLNSTLDPDEQARRLRGCLEGEYRLLYVAPERLGSARFLDLVQRMQVDRLAIDEAHCISQWGHDFRPDYLRMGELRTLLGMPPTAAFTATATADVRSDVQRQLELSEPRVFVAGFERPNLRLVVRRPGTVAEKFDLLDEALEEAGHPAIVYAATRKHVTEIARHLQSRGLAAAAYHAGLDSEERSRVQERFMQGGLEAIAATNAFGMGVDKADIRLVVHYDLPGSVESYYQEAGRAGRDGAPAQCWLLYNYADVRIQRFFLDGSNPSAGVYRAVLERLEHGPASAAEIKQWSGESNPMSVDTAIGALRRAGSIVRLPDPEIGDDLLQLVPDVPFELDERALRMKREADESRLRDMCAYAAGATCRRAYVLRYFGSETIPERCEGCDRCLGIGAPPTRELSLEERRVVRIALSGVARNDDRYGRSRLSQFLYGSKAAPILDAGLDRQPTHGMLSNLSVRVIGDLLEALADADLLHRRHLDGPGSGAILSLTPEGKRVMLEDPPLSLPIRDLFRTPRGRSRGGRKQRAEIPDDADPELVERLREWRRERATELARPAYTVFNDATLHALAALRPQTTAELIVVPGIGPSRLEAYGEEVLAILADE